MPKEVINTQAAPAAIGPYSQAVKVGPLLFVSGQLPIDMEKGVVPAGSVTKHTELAMDNLKAVVEAAGATMEQVTKVTVFLEDWDDFKFMNSVYERYFPNNPPARTTVQAKLPKNARIEVDAIAVLG
jgi:2-iminobutanoate/2-iminopropanoate deaminase